VTRSQIVVEGEWNEVSLVLRADMRPGVLSVAAAESTWSRNGLRFSLRPRDAGPEPVRLSERFAVLVSDLPGRYGGGAIRCIVETGW
jgi:hypothetical protein